MLIESPSYQKSEVDILLEKQRDESDARSIINEVERLATFEGGYRFRWIWELLQNARDEAGNGIDVVCELKENIFSFRHNGQPFKSENLLALVRRTSTKPIDGSDGNAGKFGTGFVTSHLLSKRVTIKGVHTNSSGRRRFELALDRTAESLEQMMKSISASIQDIRDINDAPPAIVEVDPWNAFEYELSESGREVAEGGIKQLKDNLAFTMLVNPQIKSISLNVYEEYITYSASLPEEVMDGVSFSSLLSSEAGKEQWGLLFRKTKDLTFAVPTKRLSGGFSLLPIGPGTRLFKELPLIGSEGSFLPVIMQHRKFQPVETRSAVRTKINSDMDEADDLKAKSNRDAFRELVNEFPSFVSTLQENKVHNLHLLAESGLPWHVDAYYDREWFANEVQKSLRAIIQQHPIVKTVMGEYISIREAIFPKSDLQYNDNLYELIGQCFPSQCPDESSYRDWLRILYDDPEEWPSGISINATQLVEMVCQEDKFQQHFPCFSEGQSWLQKLVRFLEQTQQERLGLTYTIYPNQNGGLSQQKDVFHEVNLDNRFKEISAGMGRVLEDELLPVGFEAAFVPVFNIKDFLIQLNNDIGALKLEQASPSMVQAIIGICCTFKPTRAERREHWFSLLNRILPLLSPEKFFVNLTEDYSWDPAEKWALRYVCNLIQKSETLDSFLSQYFEQNEELGLRWLNEFYDFVFRNEENKDIGLRFKIIPTQNGMFKVYDETLHLEKEPSRFAERIKTIYKEFAFKGDPLSFLIHKLVFNDYFRQADLKMLTRPIDDIFNSRDSEDLVKEGQMYHPLFLQLKEWVEEFINAEEYFPIFTKKQPILYLKAFGEGSSLGRLLKLKKNVEEIEQLDKLSLTAKQMQQLDDAVARIGNAQSLIDKANELAQFADEVRWRQKVGGAAEAAFLEALAEELPSFPKPENPDNGKDFVIRIGEKEFAIELKSAVENKETVKMSLKQGETAVAEEEAYALCVVSRPAGQITDKEQFKSNAKFVVNIGKEIGDKIIKWRTGLSSLEEDENVSVRLDSTAGGVNIKKSCWKKGATFSEFVEHLKGYFDLGNPSETTDTSCMA